MTDNNQKNNSNKNLLIQYASLGTQLLAGLIIAVFLGKWVDEKAKFTFPDFYMAVSADCNYRYDFKSS